MMALFLSRGIGDILVARNKGLVGGVGTINTITTTITTPTTFTTPINHSHNHQKTLVCNHCLFPIIGKISLILKEPEGSFWHKNSLEFNFEHTGEPYRCNYCTLAKHFHLKVSYFKDEY